MFCVFHAATHEGSLLGFSSTLSHNKYYALITNDLRQLLVLSCSCVFRMQTEKMPTFTMTLKDDAARRVREVTSFFGGSVAGFAASLADDVSKLPPEEIVRLRQDIATRIRIHSANTEKATAKG